MVCLTTHHPLSTFHAAASPKYLEVLDLAKKVNIYAQNHSTL
jgi:hypothetical protein